MEIFTCKPFGTLFYWYNLRKRWKIPQVKHVTPSLSYSNVTYHGRDALCTNTLPCRSDMSDFESVYSLQFTIISKIMMMLCIRNSEQRVSVVTKEVGTHRVECSPAQEGYHHHTLSAVIQVTLTDSEI